MPIRRTFFCPPPAEESLNLAIRLSGGVLNYGSACVRLLPGSAKIQPSCYPFTILPANDGMLARILFAFIFGATDATQNDFSCTTRNLFRCACKTRASVRLCECEIFIHTVLCSRVHASAATMSSELPRWLGY